MARTVLIVDDEAHITHVVAMKLRKAGFHVVSAADGEQGFELACQTRPDLIITDLQMPYMTGLELAARLWGNPPTAKTPVLVLTTRGYALARLYQTAPATARRDAGVHEVLALIAGCASTSWPCVNCGGDPSGRRGRVVMADAKENLIRMARALRRLGLEDAVFVDGATVESTSGTRRAPHVQHGSRTPTPRHRPRRLPPSWPSPRLVPSPQLTVARSDAEGHGLDLRVHGRAACAGAGEATTPLVRHERDVVCAPRPPPSRYSTRLNAHPPPCSWQRPPRGSRR